MQLSAFNDATKESGFYRATLTSRRAPEKVMMDPVRYGNPMKAEKADVYMLTKSTFKIECSSRQFVVGIRTRGSTRAAK